MRTSSCVLATLTLLAGCGAAAPEPPTAAERREADAQVQALGPPAWDLGEPLAAARQDLCQGGQRNAKVDEVAAACTVGRSWLLPAAADEDGVAAAIDTMRARLADLGCTPTGDDALDLARRYWAEGVQAEPGMLPGSRFTCDGVRVEVAPVSAADPRTTPITLVGDLTGGDVGTPDVDPFPADVEQQVEATGAALLWQVTAAVQYAVVP